MWPGPSLREGQTDGLGGTPQVGTQLCRSLGKPHRPHAVEAWSSVRGLREPQRSPRRALCRPGECGHAGRGGAAPPPQGLPALGMVQGTWGPVRKPEMQVVSGNFTLV